MSSDEPAGAVEWIFSVDVPEGLTMSDLRDAVAKHGEVLTVRFTLRGTKSAAPALGGRRDVLEAEADPFVV